MSNRRKHSDSLMERLKSHEYAVAYVDELHKELAEVENTLRGAVKSRREMSKKLAHAEAQLKAAAKA